MIKVIFSTKTLRFKIKNLVQLHLYTFNLMSKRNFKEAQLKGETFSVRSEEESIELPSKKAVEDKTIRKEKVKFVQPEVPANKLNQCHFYLKKKKRYCSLTAGTNSKYCGEHSHLNQVDETDLESKAKLRVPCPFDPNHTVFLTQMEKHKLKCNSKPLEVQPDYFKPDINVLLKQNSDERGSTENKLNDLSGEQVLSLVEKVKFGFDQLNLSLEGDLSQLDHKVMNDQLVKKLKVKHVVQQASLIGHLESLGLLNSDYNFAEFGAGKGELSLYVKEAIELNLRDTPNSSKLNFYLVDRKNFRLKHDRLIKEAKIKETEIVVHRIKLDIKDLSLTEVDDIHSKPVVIYSKHLCGAATDLTLNCIKDFVASGGKVAGIVIALCCHHACSYNTFVNLDYFNSLQIKDLKSDFQPFTSLSSWATCGTRTQQPQMEDKTQSEPKSSDSPTEDEHTEKNDYSTHISGLERKVREEVGFKVKRIIDSARKDYLSNFGFESRLIHYVDRSQSLENVALLATPLKANTTV